MNSIGVSNFNTEQLDYAAQIASIRPHAVQNFAQIGALDIDVRAWCGMHKAVYQPYASQRTMSSISADLLKTVEDIAAKRGVSKEVLSLRFFTQTGDVLLAILLLVLTDS